MNAASRAWVPLAVAVSCVAWGVFAFGAVYPWAYWTLAIGCVASFIAARWACPRAMPVSRALGWSLAAFAAAVVLQLVPLPPAALGLLSPAAPVALKQLSPLFALGLQTAHPLSVDPASTRTGLLLFGALAMFFCGTVRLVSTKGPRPLVRAVAVIGASVAFAGIVQKALYNGKIYGLWTPQMSGDPFGPFVNRNHFAGWMVMAVPLVLGLACAGLSRAPLPRDASWRDRMLWASSPAVSRVLMATGAATLMGMSLLMTMSRSGMMALAITLVAWIVFALRAPLAANTRRLAIAALIAGVSVGVSWVTVGALVDRFSAFNETTVMGRLGPWRDAVMVISAFPFTGTGFNTYGTSMLLYQRHDLAHHYAQAHSDYLQLAAEGGLLLVVPALVCVWFAVRDIRRGLTRDRGRSGYWLRVGAVAGLIGIAFQELLEFSLQMPGNAALAFVLLAIAVHHRESPQPGVLTESSTP